jgi:hypothetical protein
VLKSKRLLRFARNDSCDIADLLKELKGHNTNTGGHGVQPGCGAPEVEAYLWGIEGVCFAIVKEKFVIILVF